MRGQTLYQEAKAAERKYHADDEARKKAVQNVLRTWGEISPSVRNALQETQTLEDFVFPVVQENLSIRFPLWNWQKHCEGEKFSVEAMRMEAGLNGAIGLGNKLGNIVKTADSPYYVRLSGIATIGTLVLFPLNTVSELNGRNRTSVLVFLLTLLSLAYSIGGVVFIASYVSEARRRKNTARRVLREAIELDCMIHQYK